MQKIEYKSTEFVRTDDAGHHFDFVCEGCGCEGELTIPEDVPRLNCPEGCGASYMLWKNPGPSLMCVVKPVFIDEDAEDEEIHIHCPECGEWNVCTCFD